MSTATSTKLIRNLKKEALFILKPWELKTAVFKILNVLSLYKKGSKCHLFDLGGCRFN